MRRERLEVAAQRVGLVVLPAPDVGRDLVEQDVAAEETAAVLPQQRDVAVGVAGQQEHLERLAGEVERVALVHEVGRLDRRDRQLVLLLGRALRVLARHAVREQPALEAVAGAEVEPRAHGQVAVDAALHDLLAPVISARRVLAPMWSGW